MADIVSSKIDKESKIMIVSITDNMLIVYLKDGRVISTPLSWFPILQHGSVELCQLWDISEDGYEITWVRLNFTIWLGTLLQFLPNRLNPSRLWHESLPRL